jgi:hypothetical protein
MSTLLNFLELLAAGTGDHALQCFRGGAQGPVVSVGPHQEAREIPGIAQLIEEFCMLMEGLGGVGGGAAFP